MLARARVGRSLHRCSVRVLSVSSSLASSSSFSCSWSSFPSKSVSKAGAYHVPSTPSSLSFSSLSSSSSSSSVPSGNQHDARPGVNHDLTGHIQAVFNACRSENRPAFIAYTTLGFPSVSETVPIIKQLQESGADIIELGVPFSDPLAEGPVIQGSNQRALENGVNGLSECFQLVKQARDAGVTVPLLFMGYFNPFRQYGEERAIRDAHEYGVNGFILVDLPPEESDGFRSLCRQHHVSFIPLIAPTTTNARISHLTNVADSFIYAVSITGVTGANASNAINTELPSFIQKIKSNTTLPVCIGFGISSRSDFEKVEKLGDGVIVGSAIIKTLDSIKENEPNSPEKRLKALDTFIKTLTNRHTKTYVPAPLLDGRSKPEIVKTNIDVNASFGKFGGRYVPETLVAALDELDAEYQRVKKDPSFEREVKAFWHYIGRPSQLHLAERLTEYGGGARIWLKREDLNHTGAHKINNAVAQAILAKRLGKKRLIAETGAGQHGVATATIAAKLGMPLTVYMGEEDVHRQSLNVARMELMGAKVVAVASGTRTLKDAINEAMRDWVTNIRNTHYLIGSAIGPHPFPTIVRDFQSVIGQESRQQMIDKAGRLPDVVVACVGGGSNAIGMFYPFKDDASVELIGVEAGGQGTDTAHHSATLAAGTIGVLHGTRTYLLQDEISGQINGTHSISAGLDYPGVGPEHAHLKDIGRAKYVAVNDKEALMAVQLLAQTEGIIPALESAHAIWEGVQIAKKLPKDKDVLICVSGRGDKDMGIIREAFPKFGLQKLS